MIDGNGKAKLPLRVCFPTAPPEKHTNKWTTVFALQMDNHVMDMQKPSFYPLDATKAATASLRIFFFPMVLVHFGAVW